MTKLNFMTELQQQIIIGDGAIGTYLYQLGLPIGLCSEEYNITKPELIADIHRRYYDAGARLIETNTFSANRLKLTRFGLDQEVIEINQSGVTIARNAVGDDAYIFGAVGSVRSGNRGFVPDDVVRSVLIEQMSALLTAGVDGLILETFHDLQEALIAVDAAKRLSHEPIICQLAIETGGTFQDAIELDRSFQQLLDAGANIVGLNCRSGPYSMIRALEKLQRSAPYPLSIFPNAGLPAFVDGAFSYPASPQYFGETAIQFAKLGVSIIGGCCGTTPEHIAAIRQSLEQIHPTTMNNYFIEPESRSHIQISSARKPETKLSAIEPAQPSILELVQQRYTIMVELDPPRDLNIEKFLLGAKQLNEAGVDFITMADNSLAMTRMSNAALGFMVKERFGARPLLHMACRDRNMIGTQSHLMGLHAMGIDHVLAITGDPAKFGDLPGSSSVYDLTSFQMIRMMKQMNEGVSFSGKPLKTKSNFKIGVAFNPNVRHLNKAVERLEKKLAAGADFVMTQPIYDSSLLERVYDATRHLAIPIFIGIMPFTSGRNAEYLHNEVPGISLPDDVRVRMAGLEGERGRRVSIDISKELIDQVMQKFRGIYLITPFMAYEMTIELTKYIHAQAKQQLPLVSNPIIGVE
jgi:homocysteine S-methyltransferase